MDASGGSDAAHKFPLMCTSYTDLALKLSDEPSGSIRTVLQPDTGGLWVKLPPPPTDPSAASCGPTQVGWLAGAVGGVEKVNNQTNSSTSTGTQWPAGRKQERTGAVQNKAPSVDSRLKQPHPPSLHRS